MLLLLEMTQQLPCNERAAELRRLEPAPVGRQALDHVHMRTERTSVRLPRTSGSWARTKRRPCRTAMPN